MKKIIFQLFLVVVYSLNASEILLNLRDFANLASNNSSVDILISDEVDPNDFYFYTSKGSDISIGHFRKAIETKGLKLILTENFYYVDSFLDDNNSTENKPLKLRYIELKNNSYDDLASIIGDSNSIYVKSSNAISFYADDEKYGEILEIKDRVDKRLDQVTFKLTITETNIQNARDLGMHINSLGNIITREDLNLFVNLITMPFNAETNIVKTKRNGFYGVLNFLDQEGVTDIKQSPFLVAKNGSEVFFSSVDNIPYITMQQEISDAKTQTTNSYSYRDVGLQIKIKPVILKDYVDFELDLIIEDIIDSSNLTPRTSKKHLKSSYTLNRGEILVLSGINKDVSYKKRNGIPLLKDIPILKYLFSIENDYKTSNVVTLTIEVN